MARVAEAQPKVSDPSKRIMGTIAQQRGKARPADTGPDSIIRQYMQTTGANEQTVNQFIANLNKLARSGKARLVQIGNTLFLAVGYTPDQKVLPKGVVDVHVISTEDATQIAQRFVAALNTFKSMGINRVISTTEDSQAAMAVKQFSKQFPVNVRPQAGAYVLEVAL
jgi:prefoldin subunit 5